MRSKSTPLVSVVIVTWNNEAYLPRCLECLKAQSYEHCELVIVDNGSHDHSVAIAQSLMPTATVILNQTNVGFASANNQGIVASRGDYILCLNSDVFLDACFITELVTTMGQTARVGAACGKLLRATPTDTKVIDSTGLSLTPSLRSRDRGIGEIDQGQYDQAAPVFAACAAAALYRREALETVKQGNDEYFDPVFFSYYEDTDLGWRIRLAGWECLYNPNAVGRHVRGGAVAQQYSFFNKAGDFKIHTLKNRYLMLVKNLSWTDSILLLPYLLLFEIIISGYCLTHPKMAIRLLSALYKHIPQAIKFRISMRHQRQNLSNIRDLLLWPRSTSTTRFKLPI